MLRTVVAIVTSGVLLVGTVLADEIKGIITKFDTEAKKITIKTKEDEKEYPLGEDAQLVIKRKGEEKKRPLQKLMGRFKKKGFPKRPVIVTIDDDQKVTEIRFAPKKGKRKNKPKDPPRSN